MSCSPTKEIYFSNCTRVFTGKPSYEDYIEIFNGFSRIIVMSGARVESIGTKVGILVG